MPQIRRQHALSLLANSADGRTETRLLSHGVRLPAPAHISTGRMAHLIEAADPAVAAPTPIAAFGPDGSLIALVAEQDSELQPLAVFLP